jgi:hypothetical protein
VCIAVQFLNEADAPALEAPTPSAQATSAAMAINFTSSTPLY